MDQFEYKTLNISFTKPEDLVKRLNEQGLEGWEAVGIVKEALYTSGRTYVFLLKKRKQ